MSRRTIDSRGALRGNDLRATGFTTFRFPTVFTNITQPRTPPEAEPSKELGNTGGNFNPTNTGGTTLQEISLISLPAASSNDGGKAQNFCGLYN